MARYTPKKATVAMTTPVVDVNVFAAGPGDFLQLNANVMKKFRRILQRNRLRVVAVPMVVFLLPP